VASGTTLIVRALPVDVPFEVLDGFNRSGLGESDRVGELVRNPLLELLDVVVAEPPVGAQPFDQP